MQFRQGHHPGTVDHPGGDPDSGDAQVAVRGQREHVRDDGRLLLPVVPQPGAGGVPVLRPDPLTLRPAKNAPRANEPRAGHQRVC